MKKISLASLGAIYCFCSAPGHTDSYNYKLGLAYDASRTTTESTFGLTQPPATSTTKFDTDDVRISGTWYFKGLSADGGPQSRMAFVGRASMWSFGFSRGTGGASGSQSVPSSSDERTTHYSTSIRWVWPESGWYVRGNVSEVDREIDNEFGSFYFSNDSASLGVGKYVGARTTLDLTVVRLENRFIGVSRVDTEAAIALSHIGDLRGTWQYGTDVSLASTDSFTSNNSYVFRFSLYPSRPVAFGVGFSGPVEDPGDGSRYELFLSWFPREHTEVVASYGSQIVEEFPNTDFDRDDFGVDLNFRF